MAKMINLFENPQEKVIKTFRVDSAEPSYRVDSVSRTDFIGALVDEGEEVKWFNEFSTMLLKHDYTPLKKNDEGFLLGSGVATTIGVFPYRRDDGTIRYELRSPEEVYHPDSIASLKMVPVTNEHPTEEVTSVNVNKYKVGNVGEDIRVDERHGFVSTPLTIQQDTAVADVEAGKRGLSCGYTTDVIERPGVWGGVRYDAVQTNIRYNHLAIVDEGRAGDDAILKMDGAMQKLDQSTPRTTDTKQPKQDRGGKMKLTLDGISCEADDRVVEHLHSANARADKVAEEKLTADTALVEAGKKIETHEATIEQMKADAKISKEKLDNSISKEDFDEKLAETKKLDEAVAKSKAVVKEDATDLDKKKAVILAMDKDADLKDKSDTHIDVRFDMTCDNLKKLTEADIKDTQDLSIDSADVIDDPAPGSKKKVDSAEPTPEEKLKLKLDKKWRDS